MHGRRSQGPSGRSEPLRRTVPRVAEFLLQRAGAGARDGSAPDARHEVDGPVEGVDGFAETPEYERATGRAGGSCEEAADPLPAATDRCGKDLIHARTGMLRSHVQITALTPDFGVETQPTPGTHASSVHGSRGAWIGRL